MTCGLPEQPNRRLLLGWCLWTALCMGLLLTAIGARCYHSFGFPLETSARLYALTALPGHYFTLALIGTLPAMLAALIAPRPRIVTPIFVGCHAALLALITLNAQVFELYRFHLNAMVWNAVTGGAAFDIFDFSVRDYGLSVVGLVAAVGVPTWMGRRVAAKIGTALVKRGRRVAAVIALIIITPQLVYMCADALAYRPIVTQLAVLPWAQPITAKRALAKYGLVASRQPMPTLGSARRGMLDYPKQPLVCPEPGLTGDPNFLFILVDALRFDMLEREIMPTSTALAERSSLFRNHFSAGNATRFGVFGLFYGISGSYWHNMLAENRGPVLIQKLVERDYDFGIFASARLTSPEFDRTVFAPIADQLPPPAPGDTKWERDLVVNERFREFLDKREADDDKRPFFSLLFYDSTHGYAHPDDYALKFTPSLEVVSYIGLDTEEDREPFLNRYKNSAHFVDDLIGEALAELEERGLSDSTTIVFTSDHGQEFNETGLNFWGHNGNFSQWQTKVPMFMYRPGQAPQTFDHRSSHLDVVPTLAKELWQCETPVEDYSAGKSLFEPGGRDPIQLWSWSRMALLSGDQLQVINNTSAMDHYDLDYGEIPDDEQHAADLLAVMKANSKFYR